MIAYHRVSGSCRRGDRDYISVCEKTSAAYSNSARLLHLSYFLCRHGPQDKGILFLLRTTRYWPVSGEAPLEECVEGGVGVIILLVLRSTCTNSVEVCDSPFE